MENAGSRVIAAVIERDGRYLVCQRPAHKRHGMLWEFPGGKLESGESLADAAKRELAEELGMTVSSVGSVLYSVIDAGSQFQIDFVKVTAEGEPMLLEHAQLEWASISELDKFLLAPSDRKFVEAMQAKRTPHA